MIYFTDSNDNHLTINIIKYILKAVKFGDKDARKMFPILLLELEKNSDDREVIESFKNEVNILLKFKD